MGPNSSPCLLISRGFNSAPFVRGRVFDIARASKWDLVDRVSNVFSYFKGVKGPLYGNFFQFFLNKNGTNYAFFGEVLSIPMGRSFLDRYQNKNNFPFAFPTFCLLVSTALKVNVVVRGRLVTLPIAFAENVGCNSHVFRRKCGVECSR